MNFLHIGGRALTPKTQLGLRAAAVYLIALLGGLGTPDAQATVPASERVALIDFYNSTNGASWINNTGWLGAAGTECSWIGVTCNAAGTTVTEIYRSTKGLTGTLPSSITQLVNLQYFAVDGNKLIGSIPALTGMSALINVNLNRNLLDGSIGSFSALPALQFFSAQSNLLTGSIPALTSLPQLRTLSLSANRLSGSIPALNALPLLSDVNLSSNALTGSVPSLAGLANLNDIYLSNNRLSGSLPSLASLSNLTGFTAQNNQLTGPPPTPPATHSLLANNSALCPNPMTAVADAEWDAATGRTPWSVDCTTTFVATPVPSAGGIIFPDWPQLTGSVFPFAQFRVVPNAGYGVIVGGTCPRGSLSGTTYSTFSMTSNCTVAPTFSNAVFTVNVATTAGGTVTPLGPQSRLFGSDITVIGTPDAGYRRSSIVTACGGVAGYFSDGAANTASTTITTYPINGNCSVNFTFAPLAVNVTANASVAEEAGVAHGSVSPTSRTVAQGQSTTFTVIPDVGYRTDNVQGCGATLAGNIATTAALTADCNMVAVLAKTCALDVDTNLSTNAATDGALILRYLLGFRGAALVDGLAGVNPANATAIANYIGDHRYLGVEPAGPSAAVTGLILYRLMDGYPDSDLLNGIQRPSGLPFQTAAAIRADVNAQCASHF